jgi:hypothetical protein
MLALCLAGTVPAVRATGDAPGALSIRATLPLHAAQRRSLRELVAGHSEAREIFVALEAEAQKHFDFEPRPLRVIHYEGLLNTDSRRIETVERLLSGLCRGRKERREWSNSRVALDRRRAEAGIESYRQGRPYEPNDALRLLEEASYFDPSPTPLVLKLHGGAAKRFPSWTMVVNAACQAAGSMR